MTTLTLVARPERKSLASGKRASLRVAFTIRASGAKVESERPALACALLLDVSGSMSGPPLEALIQSVENLCELAQPGDRLAMVAFSDSASVVAPFTEMDVAGRRLLASRARRLVPDGGTNIEDALRKGAGLLDSEKNDSKANEARRSLLLLSDGQPNRGASSVEALASVVAELRPGLSVSTLGYGIRHSEDILAGVADAGAGRFRFIANPVSCRRDLAAALGAQGDVVAGSIELAFAPADGVEIRRFVGDPSVRFGRDGARLALSDMEDRSQRIVAVELDLTKPLDPSGLVLDVRLSYRDASSGAAHEIHVPLAVDVTSEDGPIDPEACATLLLVRAEETRKQARALADRGQFEGAAALLRGLLSEIERAPGYAASDGSPLSEAHELLLDEVIAYERNPSPESYGVFRKQTIMFKLDQDATHSVMPMQGALSRRFSQITQGTARRAHLVLVSGGEEGRVYPLGDSCAIGRTAGADVVVASPSVSRRHAEIYALQSDHWICDLGSTNTTEVNGKRLTTAPHKLEDGDLIRVGAVELRYRLGDPTT